MKIKYNTVTNEIVEVQTHQTHILVAGKDEEIKEVQSQKVYAGMKLDGETVREKRSDEIQYEKTQGEKRLDELKEKQTLTLPEVTEILKLRGLI